MKVLDLGCSSGHVFEGWFASEDDFQSQLSGGMLVCPVCGATQVQKRLSAPRLNLGASDSDQSPSVSSRAVATQSDVAPTQQQVVLLNALKEMLAKTEDVGEQFVEQARRMHNGEEDSRPIRGQASLSDALELIEEGIDVLPIPDLPLLKGPLH